MINEIDRKHLEESLGIFRFNQGGGVKYSIPKSGKHRDSCFRGMGHGIGEIQGYLLALREHNLITYEEWHGLMTQYVYGQA